MLKKQKKCLSKGMTLVEVLIALVLIVGLTGHSLSFMNRKDSAIKKILRQWTALNRQLDYQAHLQGQVWRLVIDLDKNRYWVEKQVAEVNNSSADSEDSESNTAVSSSQKKDSTVSSEGFILDKNFFEKPQTLPKKFSFESVELSHQKTSLKEGLAFIYYLPEGQFSRTLVLIKYKKTYRSLLFNRLRGDMEVFSENKQLKDLTP